MRQTEGETRLASALEERYAFFHASCRINLVQREANVRELRFFFSKQLFFLEKGNDCYDYVMSFVCLKRTVFSNIANTFLSAKSIHGGRNIS